MENMRRQWKTVRGCKGRRLQEARSRWGGVLIEEDEQEQTAGWQDDRAVKRTRSVKRWFKCETGLCRYGKSNGAYDWTD